MTKTVARARLAKLDSAALIEQYELAISSWAGRCTNTSPRQQRIGYIVDMLSDRADQGDAIALRWLDDA